MSRPDWISAELPGGFGGIKQCDSIWISPRLCRAGNEPGYFSDEGPSILVKSKVYSSAHHCAAAHSKQTQVYGLPHNLRWNVCRFNKIWQKLLHRFGWNQGKNHAMFGLISIISATAVLLSLTAPKLCKFAELSKGPIALISIACYQMVQMTPQCGWKVQWVLCRRVRIVTWHQSAMMWCQQRWLPSSYNNIYFVLLCYNISIIDNIDSGHHHYY